MITNLKSNIIINATLAKMLNYLIEQIQVWTIIIGHHDCTRHVQAELELSSIPDRSYEDTFQDA